jgi:hypothetical protein
MNASAVRRYLLVLENGEPADPAAYVSAREAWDEGDTLDAERQSCDRLGQ